MTDNDMSAEENQKRAIFESMSERSKKRILKQGYDAWNPFEMPKDPIDIRRDKTKRTTQTLVREFLQSRTQEEYSNEYGRGAFDIALGIINDDPRSKGMFDFSVWYHELLKKEGYTEE